MKKLARGFLILALFWGTTSLQTARGGAQERQDKAPLVRSPIVGTLYHGSAYTTDTSNGFLKGDFADQPIVARFYNVGLTLPAGDYPPRWRIVSDEWMMIHAHIPDFSEALGGRRDFSLLLCSLEKLPKRSDDGRRTPQPQLRREDHFLAISREIASEFSEILLTTMNASIHYAMRERAGKKKYESILPSQYRPQYRFCYDLVPIKHATYSLFVLANGKLQTAMDKNRAEAVKQPPPFGLTQPPAAHRIPYDSEAFDLPVEPLLGVWQVDEKQQQWVLVEKIVPSFDERFWVFVKGSTYFFVTDSGTVYLSNKPEKGNRRMEPVWTDARRPIGAVITDSASGKTFLFGRSDKQSEDSNFYFELEAKPQPQLYKRTTLKPVNTVEPLKTVMELGRFLSDEKKVKLTK